MNLVDVVNQTYVEKLKIDMPDFRPGDTVSVHVKIKEGARERIQLFQGICIAIKEKGHLSGHFRVRKISSGGIGVERVFPYHCPSVAKIEVKERGKSRRAKHFYLRERTGKGAKIATDYSNS